MKKFSIISCLFISCLLNAQNTVEELKEVSKKTYKIDSIKTPLIKVFDIKFDSIRMKIKHYENIIEAEGYIGKSKNLLKITYYLKLNELQAIDSKEISPIMDDLFFQWIFDVEKNKVVSEFPSYNVRTCLSILPNENFYEAYGYNEKWDVKFLKNQLMELYVNIKNYH